MNITTIQQRLVNEHAVIVWDDRDPSTFWLWFCKPEDAPPMGRVFRSQALPEPLTSLPGEWLRLCTLDTDEADASTLRFCIGLWAEGTRMARRTALLINRPRLATIESDDEDHEAPLPGWMAFCPNGTVLTDCPAQRWPHPCHQEARFKPAYRQQRRELAQRWRYGPALRTRKAMKWEWIRTRNAILCAQHEQPGINFWTHYAWQEKEGHFEGYFCGSARRVWRFEIQTLRHAYACLVEEKVSEERRALEASADDDFSFGDPEMPMVPMGHSRFSTMAGEQYAYRWLRPHRQSERACERIAQERARVRALADERRFTVCEQARVAADRERVRGVHFIVADEYLSPAIVQARIVQFLHDGERDWRSTVPHHFGAEAVFGNELSRDHPLAMSGDAKDHKEQSVQEKDS